jgi:hypothetical protein
MSLAREGLDAEGDEAMKRRAAEAENMTGKAAGRRSGAGARARFRCLETLALC